MMNRHPSLWLGTFFLAAATASPSIGLAGSVQKTGARGGTVAAGTTQKGNTVSGTATATTAGGKTASANGTATVKPSGVTAQGTATGVNGATASGSATESNGSINAAGTANCGGGAVSDLRQPGPGNSESVNAVTDASLLDTSPGAAACMASAKTLLWSNQRRNQSWSRIQTSCSR